MPASDSASAGPLRALIERYLAWLAALALADSTKALSGVFRLAFLEENRRDRWVGFHSYGRTSSSGWAVQEGNVEEMMVTGTLRVRASLIRCT